MSRLAAWFQDQGNLTDCEVDQHACLSHPRAAECVVEDGDRELLELPLHLPSIPNIDQTALNPILVVHRYILFNFFFFLFSFCSHLFSFFLSFFFWIFVVVVDFFFF